MAIYAIGDLHLSFADNKKMDIFGDNWVGHEEKIKKVLFFLEPTCYTMLEDRAR